MGAKESPRLEGCIQRGEEIQPDVFEVQGSVKWFDPSKGYGFIAPDEDLPDVLLHVTCLRRGGFQTAFEGARVVCEVVRKFQGSTGRPHLQHGQLHGDPSIRVAAAHPCGRQSRERLGKSGGEVVQPTTRVWLPDTRSRDARHFCSYGNASPLRFHRA